MTLAAPIRDEHTRGIGILIRRHIQGPHTVLTPHIENAVAAAVDVKRLRAAIQLAWIRVLQVRGA
jgi:hypothetical protein